MSKIQVILYLSGIGGATIAGSVALIWRHRFIQARDLRDFRRRDTEFSNNFLESRGWISRGDGTWDLEAMLGLTPPEQAHIQRNTHDTFINSFLENENIINQDLILWLITFIIISLFYYYIYKNIFFKKRKYY